MGAIALALVYIGFPLGCFAFFWVVTGLVLSLEDWLKSRGTE